ncbi:ABC transporter ATP-binding protein [Cytobacillus oceanisediminis]|uniref:ABC transporter ATP-binding protein n=1 Tax=Cytobacillus oceanisediminis TaxID=665099 RepID=A0ABX3CKJ0_9BACI|nr:MULTISPECIES: ABC transporter ATP-binding protein [Cytobacillus]MBY0159536.1 ABC transporter ATP-binding protein [Cytobacillus firmus]MCM3391939.1 ABC transporter ATP-binding protein [Cytobacillus oceanisediminis]MCM3528350.1 ABC transporter ATP-binding protein [Cytobacillus oceanisediminis]MCS0823209.1 ABC transporter ATP-binding protein [Cytobacillus firmus]OHX41979.1 ABC transporter ATP-binding protein [Cytobacillus oceanisediminis]
MIQLSVNHLTKSFDTNQVLDNLSFHVNEGEFVSILGPSGSGKSTIFNLIGGMLLPDEGSITLENVKINGKRGSISYMPQTPSLMPWRTILQNVLLGQELMGKTDSEAARKMLQKAGLGGYENAYPHELSGGMKQRAAFIRALLSPQPIILLDEPFSALDELTRHDMQKWLLDIWNEHKPTILFVTHNIEEAIYLSDRILVLSSKPAKVIKEYKVPFNRPRMEELYLNENFLACKRSIHHALKNH